MDLASRNASRLAARVSRARLAARNRAEDEAWAERTCNELRPAGNFFCGKLRRFGYTIRFAHIGVYALSALTAIKTFEAIAASRQPRCGKRSDNRRGTDWCSWRWEAPIS